MPRSYATSVPKIIMHNANDFGGGQYRILQPAGLLRQHGFATVMAHPQIMDDNMLNILRPDVVVVQFQQTDIQIEAMRRYRKTLKDLFFVYEIDDLFWGVPDASFHKATLPPDTKERIQAAAKICDAITVTTERLAQEMRRLTKNTDVRVVPNEVPMQFVNAALAGRRAANITSTKPRIGWAGGIGHSGDLEIVTNIMNILGSDVHWVFMGMVPPGVEKAMQAHLGISDQDWAMAKTRPDYQHLLSQHLNADKVNPAFGLPATVEFHPGVPFANYAAVLGSLRLDIALAPLEHNTFNICKSDLRLLEYGAAGFPVIATDISTYEACPHIVRLPNDPEVWAQNIRDLLGDPKLSDLAEGLHKWVVNERCMDKNLATRIKAYLPRHTVTFSPNAAPMPLPGPIVTVGADLDGLQNFSTMAEAWAAVPGANILYLRPNAAVNALQLQRMCAPLLEGHASVSTLSNDSIYPAPSQFAQMDALSAHKLDMCASLLTDAPVTIPSPTGPCILFAGSALGRYGLPLDQHHLDDPELGFTEWGARAVEGGRTHVMTADTYIHAGTPIRRTKETVEWAINRAVAWVPGLAQMLQNYVQSDPLAHVRRNLELEFHRWCYETPRPEGSYLGWTKVFDTVGPADVAAMREQTATWENLPHINIVMPTFNTPYEFLTQAIESVLAQTYPNWSLLIADDCSTDPEVVRIIDRWAQMDERIKYVLRPENGHICRASNSALELATDGWVVFLDHDDTLAPQALWMIAREVTAYPDVQFIYSDVDKLTEQGERTAPYFSPDFNYDLLLASNYVTHLAAYRLDGIRAIEGLRPGYEGSQDWDLVLRYLTDRCGTPPDRNLVRHIPNVLYHWRMSANSTSANIEAKPYALDAGRRAVLDHLTATKQHGAMVAANPQAPIVTMVRYLVSDPAPKVSIIIPTRDNAKVLTRCLTSLIQRTAYPNYEVVVVDNGSKDPATLRMLTDIQKDKRIRVRRHPGPFNYSAMNNGAAENADGDFLCLLNDDTEIAEGVWLNDLVGLAARPGVGAVGAKLLYPTGMVQQNGIFIDWDARPGNRAMHAWQQLQTSNPGQASRNLITQEYTAVTGACLVVRRSLYLEMGGLDAEVFPVDYNDVDFCLRLFAAGYRNLVSAQAVVIHHEGTTKRKFASEHMLPRVIADEARLLERHGHLVDGQWNRNLTFHPHLDKIASPGLDKPWVVDRQRLLLINGTTEDAMTAWNDGYLPFCATLDGHGLHMTYPQMGHVKPIDVRGPVEPFVEILGVLNIPRLVFCGVGNGTIGAVGFLTEVTRQGWPVEYRSTTTADFRDVYVAADAWVTALARLRQAQPSDDFVEAAEDVVA